MAQISKKSKKVVSLRLSIEQEKEAERLGMSPVDYIEFKLSKKKPTIGTYTKECQFCKEKFVGRKNQIYCSYTCQVDNKNENAKKQRLKYKNITQIVKNG